MRYVAGAGVVNCDILYSGITRLPSEGEEIFSTGFDLQLGGGVPGIMVNLARLGVPVKFSTYLGNDFFSQFVKNQLEQFGVHYVNLYSGTGMPVNVTSVVITPKDRTFISHRDDFGYNDTMKQQLFEQLRGASIIRMSNHLYEVYSRIKQENPDTIFVMDTGWDDTMSLDSYAKYLELMTSWKNTRMMQMLLSVISDLGSIQHLWSPRKLKSSPNRIEMVHKL